MKKDIDFHIKNNDYFETLATSLSLVSQHLAKEDKKYADILNNLVEELMYLKDNYTISSKNL